MQKYTLKPDNCQGVVKKCCISLKESGKVSLKIYNIQGQLVRTLLDEDKVAGCHSVMWNGTNDQGIHVTSGTYLYTLKINGFEETKKMSFMK